MNEDVRRKTVLSSLPLPPTGERVIGTDSHDVTGGNNDGFGGTYSYLYEDERGKVLFDHKGAGCVTLVRTIGFEGSLRVYVDDAPEPAVDIPFSDLHSGALPDYPDHLACDEVHGHGSAWWFCSVPFGTRCVIVAANDVTKHPYRFYNITAYACASREEADELAARVSDAQKREQWLHPEDMRALHRSVTASAGSVDVPARGRTSLVRQKGKGCVCWLRLRLPSSDPAVLEGLRLLASWDDARLPSVDAPVGMFFALGAPSEGAESYRLGEGKHTVTIPTGTTRPTGVPVGQSEDGTLYCNFPMPFADGALIELANMTGTGIRGVEWEAGISEACYGEGAGRFAAVYRREDNVLPGRDYTFLDVRGSGKYVGCVMRASSRQMEDGRTPIARMYLEGDARFYVDDARAFLCGSTGSEEYFLWGWYDMPPKDEPFAFPTHGYTEHVRNLQDHSTMYRFHVSDPIPFCRSFRFEIEHGPEGETPADYSSVAFCYLSPKQTLRLTGAVEATDCASEGKVWEGECRLFYEGNDQIRAMRRAAQGEDWYRVAGELSHGVAFTGAQTLTVEVDPGNGGVLLRRTFDGRWPDLDHAPGPPEESHLVPAQEVRVRVDGEDAGVWYRAPGHWRACWMEDEFEIPARLTHGKESVEITLESTGPAAWNAFRYTVFARCGGREGKDASC